MFSHISDFDSPITKLLESVRRAKLLLYWWRSSISTAKWDINFNQTVDTHVKKRSIRLQKWWTTVKSITVKTQPKQQMVIYAIDRFKTSIHYLNGGILHYYMWTFQLLFCDHALGAPGIPYFIPYNPLKVVILVITRYTYYN